MKYFLISLIFVHCFVFAQSATELAEKGKQAIQQLEFEQASQYYKEAAKAMPENEEYSNLALFLRNVVTLRAKLPKEKDNRRWAQISLSLRAFYMEHKLYTEVASISKQMYEKFNNPIAAYMLGESYILTKQNQLAVDFLGNLKEKTSPLSKVLLGIAYARLGNNKESNIIVAELRKDTLQQPAFCYHFAILETLLQNQESALQHIALGLENTPPSQADSYKQMILENPELKILQSNAMFTKTMQTASKIQESGCSGGSSCSSCPSRGSCGSQKSSSSSCGKTGCTDSNCGKK